MIAYTRARIDRIKGRPDIALLLMAAASPLAFSVWMSLINNFTIERAGFTGVEIGILQSIREIPGLLAFTVLLFVGLIREQSLMIISLILLGLGVMMTGHYPTATGLYLTTVIMSIGFHYAEALQMSLTLQWIPKDRAPQQLGRQVSAKSFASIASYIIVWVSLELLGFDYSIIYMVAGGLAIVLALIVWGIFPAFPEYHKQHTHMFLRKRYWLFYALTFLSGARRQIFVVFAGFLLVDKFGYSAATVTVLYLVNHIIAMATAPTIGKMVHRWGERKALLLEYSGLIIVFISYGLTESPLIAAGLYILDHLFFALAIAQKSYLQKIADPQDISATSSVSFSINHIAAVVLPALLGLLWMISPAWVFYCGAILAFFSLILSSLIPDNPTPENETRLQLFKV